MARRCIASVAAVLSLTGCASLGSWNGHTISKADVKRACEDLHAGLTYFSTYPGPDLPPLGGADAVAVLDWKRNTSHAVELLGATDEYARYSSSVRYDSSLLAAIEGLIRAIADASVLPAETPVVTPIPDPALAERCRSVGVTLS
jgi:hypothetical protein